MDTPTLDTPTHLPLTRRAVGLLFFAGYALAALSADAAPITTPTSGLTIDEPRIPNGAPHPLPAYVVRPQSPGPHPAIIVANEVFGIHAYIKDICARLARLGYVAIAPDFFYRSGANLPAMTSIDEIRPIVMQATPDQVDADVRATTAWLKAQPFVAPTKIGITGFCWGGAVVRRSAMVNSDIRAGVAWYGQLKPLIPRAAELRAPVLGLYGAQDAGIPQDDVEAMRAALKAAGKTGSTIMSMPTRATASTPTTARATTKPMPRTAGPGCSPISGRMASDLLVPPPCKGGGRGWVPSCRKVRLASAGCRPSPAPTLP